MADVILHRVSKRYVAGGPFAVRDVSLNIGDGELAVIVGPSGCGKSTILRMIAGLEDVTSGELSIDGRNLSSVPPRDRNVAMMFQDSALYPHMTVRQNLAFALRMRKMSSAEIDRRVRDTANALEIADWLDRTPCSLSGGQRQRVSLGRAAVRAPEAGCLLLDEPLSNLDAGLRVVMRQEIKALHQRLNATMIHVTHDQEEAMTLGDRLIVMAEGAVQQDGSPMEVYHKPCNRFVAGFIGSPAMNFLDGMVVGERGRAAFVESGSGGARVDLAGVMIPAELFGGSVTMVLGVRPEHLTVQPVIASVIGGGVRCRVQFIVHRGHEMLVQTVTDAGNAITVRMPASAQPLIAGDTIQLAIDPIRTHLFQPGAFGQRINSSADSS